MNIEDKDLINYHCPRWNELPEIELYVDQVVSIIQKNLAVFSKDKETPVITSSMINNYVKNNILEAPEKKKYKREHLAKLFVICICKKLMSISEIGESIKIMQKIYSVEDGYNIFCEELEKAIKRTFEFKEKNNDNNEEDSRELTTLKAITAAFSDAVLVDKLIAMRNK